MDKKARPFERLGLNVSPLEVDSAAVGLLNEVIQKHNQACDDFQARVSSARKRLEADSVSAALDEFKRLGRHRFWGDGRPRVNAAANRDRMRLTEKIASLEREIVEHRQPAEELNDDLRKYLGHSELVPGDQGHRVHDHTKWYSGAGAERGRNDRDRLALLS